MAGVFRRIWRRHRRAPFVPTKLPAGIVQIGKALEGDRAFLWPRIIGRATETDLARNFTIPVASGARIDETGRWVHPSNGLDERGNRIFGLVSERGARVFIAVVSPTDKTVAIGQAIEVDVAGSFLRINAALETDEAETIEPVHVVVLGRGIDAEVTRAITVLRLRPIGRALETDEAFAFAMGRHIGQALEIDLVRAFTIIQLAPNKGFARGRDAPAGVVGGKDATAGAAKGTDS